MTTRPKQHRYRRTRNGDVLHRALCQFAKAGVPWPWADTVSRRELRETSSYLGLHACEKCEPLAGDR